MRKGICPKCNSQEVYSGENISFKKGPYSINTIHMGGVLGSQAALDNYVCCECGYVESYISHPKDLKKISVQWEKVRS
ncbi:hypothetical protein [Candidatus Contubernalis alkaliaceticus]|uniref:hypothetical protein n=1 Tax=Candidatus Contubernalis alkaliaceticus TaxID=338645 RepID=UPI001F4C2AAD|nr:hypothetical protein [Candidatus Contubernalis alkalaceticus]UNC91326.1 hypothetical protein HUE98_04005 [Candidatus Contubernalis alkalaceticus]